MISVREARRTTGFPQEVEGEKLGGAQDVINASPHMAQVERSRRRDCQEHLSAFVRECVGVCVLQRRGSRDSSALFDKLCVCVCCAFLIYFST